MEMEIKLLKKLKKITTIELKKENLIEERSYC